MRPGEAAAYERTLRAKEQRCAAALRTFVDVAFAPCLPILRWLNRLLTR
jgi:hypothetical protein